jgi:carboxyl-terminal processing protease
MKNPIPSWASGLLGTLLLAFTGFLAVTPADARDTPAERASSLELFLDVYGLTRSAYVDTVESRVLMEAALQGMLQSLDPNSMLLTPREYENLRIQLEGSFEGVGITLGQREDRLTVISPIEGTPAHRAGMRAGDTIITIDGATTEGMTTDEAVSFIRGPGGTVVTLQVIRAGIEDTLNFPIERAMIDVPSLTAHFMLEPGIGYIRLARFSEESLIEVRDAIQELQGQGATRLVFDIRSNSGGLLNPAIDLADLFLSAGTPIVTTRGQAVGEQIYRARGDVFFSGETAVLVDGGSASSSEIFAGALQDNGVATIIGSRTFGKGSVQSLTDLGEYPGLGHYGVKLTTARYYTPSGRSIDRTLRDDFMEQGAEEDWGIVPDIAVEASEFDGRLVYLLEYEGYFFGFAGEYVLENTVPYEFWPDDQVIEDFILYLGEDGVEFTPEEFQESRDYIERALLREIGLREWPMDHYYEVLSPRDPCILAALEHLGGGAGQR